MAAYVRGLAVPALFAAALVPASAQALPSMSASAGPNGSQGDTCTTFSAHNSSNVPSFLAQSADFNCENVEGRSSGIASADIGTLKAQAFTFSRVGINRGSLSAEGASASASYIDDDFVFSNTTGNPAQVILVRSNVHFSATVTAVGLAGGSVDADESINGVITVHCDANENHSQHCDSFPVFVPVGVPVTETLVLNARAFANANGQLENASLLADASHTFSFPLNGPVFDLPPGFTVNTPNSFIFNNRFTPPSADAGSVPEPGALSLLLAGLTGLLLTNRGCRRNGSV